MRLDFQRKAEQYLLIRGDGSGIKVRLSGASGVSGVSGLNSSSTAASAS